MVISGISVFGPNIIPQEIVIQLALLLRSCFMFLELSILNTGRFKGVSESRKAAAYDFVLPGKSPTSAAPPPWVANVASENNLFSAPEPQLNVVPRNERLRQRANARADPSGREGADDLEGESESTGPGIQRTEEAKTKRDEIWKKKRAQFLREAGSGSSSSEPKSMNALIPAPEHDMIGNPNRFHNHIKPALPSIASEDATTSNEGFFNRGPPPGYPNDVTADPGAPPAAKHAKSELEILHELGDRKFGRPRLNAEMHNHRRTNIRDQDQQERGLCFGFSA